jgi:metallopeptidase MepB
MVYLAHRSQLYSSDMFHAVFNQESMNRTQGLRYRKMVLEKGSSEDEMKFLQAFLGRRPNHNAFQMELEKAWDCMRPAKVCRSV